MFGIETKNENVKYFYTASVSAGLRWQVWTKKRGVKFYTFICIGAGGAGGNGFSAAASAARGGGGGGGSGAISRLRIHASLLPDTLFMYAGKGGTQVGTATGEVSAIFLSNRTGGLSQNANILLRSGNSNAGAGGNGTGAAAGALGAASTIDTTSNAIFSAWGEYISIAGHAGVAGGAQTGANGTGITGLALPISGGCGGGGVTTTDFTGGSINISNGFLYPIISGGAGGGANRGGDGVMLQYPLRMLGGAGGGTNNTGTGGAGGIGGIGCGGGGGGGGVTGGTGGNGGDGLIIVIEEY